MDTKKDWTHKNISITDIRKLPEFYVFTISDDIIKSSLTVKSKIFEDRLRPYFLKDISEVSRKDILENVRWNMYITKGYYIKIYIQEGTEKCQKFDMDPDKYYVSYLEIDGPLGTFQSIYNQITHKES
jgi:hypothetical protein